MVSVVLLQAPSPPRLEVTRDYAGGFGVAIQVRRRGYGHGHFTMPYSSLMYSAAVLKENEHDITYIDAQAERLNEATTIARVSKSKPEIVVTVANLPSIYGDGALNQRLMRDNPDSKLVCIGTVCKALPEELARMNAADFIVMGEPESVLPELVRRIQVEEDVSGLNGVGIANGGNLDVAESSTEMVDLKTLPWPPHDLMPMTHYRDPHFGANVRFFPMWASRGCPMPCSFYCPYPVGMGSRSRLRPSEDVVREMAHLYHEFGVRAFLFRDQLFSSKTSRSEEICNLILDNKLRIKWLCETRFDLVSERLLKKMKKAGCIRVHFGLETGDPELLREIGKPGLKISVVREVVKMTKETGMKPLTHIILGLPGETRTTIQRTLRTLKELGVVNVSVNIATPYPGTPLFDYAKDHGLIETEDWSRYTSFNAVMRTEEMTTADLEESRESLLRAISGKSFLGRGVSYFKSKMSSLFQ